MTDQHGFLTGQGREQPRPGWSIDKFDDHGRVRATPGLTTLCHIDQESAGFAALVQAQQALRAGPHAGAFAFLPQDSLHMTVFDGVIDYRRGQLGRQSDGQGGIQHGQVGEQEIAADEGLLSAGGIFDHQDHGHL